jgi:hypothetical protein
MTQGETLFYLREIHAHWSTSNVSSEKLAVLKAANLIEMNGQPIAAVRLTREGALTKALGRPTRSTGNALSSHQTTPARKKHHRKKAVARPRPLV